MGKDKKAAPSKSDKKSGGAKGGKSEKETQDKKGGKNSVKVWWLLNNFIKNILVSINYNYDMNEQKVT